MKVLRNPELGANIEGFIFKKIKYNFPVGKELTMPEDLANALLNSYPFLEEVKAGDGQYLCKYGDFASDTKIAVAGHEKAHEARIAKQVAVMQPEEFITPQEKLDEERRHQYDLVGTDGIPTGNAVDKDGIEWYGPGLEKDSPGGSDDEF